MADENSSNLPGGVGPDFDIVQIISDIRSSSGRSKRGILARRWFRKNVEDIFTQYKPNDRKNIIADNTISVRGKKYVGKMYMFLYDPKHKQTLPYYDKFPLIFIIGFYDDGFLGINLHYLPLEWRVRLLKRLYSLKTDKNYDDNTKLKLSYDTIKKFSKYRLAEPCIKRYLYTHVRSRFRLISASNWEMAIFMPTARWRKQSEAQVHADTRRKVRNRRRRRWGLF